MTTISKLLQLGVLATFMASPLFCSAGTLVRGEEMLHGDKDLDKARRDASYPAEYILKRTAGVPKTCAKIESVRQDPDCRQNKAGYWFCTGVTSVGCALTTHDDEARRKKIADEAAEKAAKVESVSIDRNKEITGWKKPESQSFTSPLSEAEKRNMKQRTELAARLKEKEDRDTDIAKRRFADRERADKEAVAKSPREKEEAPLNKSEVDPFASLAKPGSKSAAGKPGSTDPFASLEIGKPQGKPAPSQDMDVVIERAEAERVATEKRKRLDESARASCERDLARQERCSKDTCGSEPVPEICVRHSDVMDRPNTGGRGGLFVPNYPCVEKGPNPDHAKWKICLRNSSTLCGPQGNKIISLSSCVSERAQL
jgi:hypothetical protein